MFNYNHKRQKKIMEDKHRNKEQGQQLEKSNKCDGH